MSRPAASLGTMRMIKAVPDRLDGSPRQLRRFWSDEFKATAIEQACQPGANDSAIARQIGVLPSQLYRWRRELLGSDEPQQAAGTDEPQSAASGAGPIVEIIIGNMIVRAGRHVDAEKRIERLTKILKAFDRARFGRRSEKLGTASIDDEQQAFVFEEIKTGIAAIRAQVNKGSAHPDGKRPPRPRKGFAPHLERVEVVIEPDELPEHAGKRKVLIGEDVSERLDVVPAMLRHITTPSATTRTVVGSPSSQDGPHRRVTLKTFTGILQANAYRGYTPLFK